MNSDQTQSLQEQAQEYVNREAEGTTGEYPFGRVSLKLAYLAGAQSTQAEVNELKEWKRQAMIVMPDMHEIGKALGIKIGQSVHDKILPGIQSLRSKLQLAEKALQDLTIEANRPHMISIATEALNEINPT